MYGIHAANAPKHSGGRLFSEKFFIHFIQTRAKETDNAARAKVRVFTPFFFGLGSFGQDLCFVEITEADRYYLMLAVEGRRTVNDILVI